MLKVKNVFVIEDSPIDFEIIRQHVLRVIPEALFTHASTIANFKKKVSWTKPDLILSDYNLPDGNGLEVMLDCKVILPNSPFIFVTGTLDSEQQSAKAILEGASGYVLKDNMGALEPQLLLAIQKRNEALTRNFEVQEYKSEILRLNQLITDQVIASTIEEREAIVANCNELMKLVLKI